MPRLQGPVGVGEFLGRGLPASARRSRARASATPNRSATVRPAGLDGLAQHAEPAADATRRRTAAAARRRSASSVVLPTPLRPTRPVRSGPKLRSRLEKSGGPSGVAQARSDRVMEAGMEMDFPEGKARWRCGRGEIHCGVHSCWLWSGRGT